MDSRFYTHWLPQLVNPQLFNTQVHLLSVIIIIKPRQKLTLFDKNTRFFPSVKSILSPEPNTRQSRARHRPLEDGPVLCTQGVPASWQRLSRSLLRGLVPPLDVDDLQYGQQQLESILDVGRAVGRL